MDIFTVGEYSLTKIHQMTQLNYNGGKNSDYSLALFIIGLNLIPFYAYLHFRENIDSLLCP